RTDQAEGKIVEQGDHARALEKGRKDHEDEDVGGGNVDRGAVDAFDTEGENVHHLREIIATRDEGRRQVVSHKAIGEEDESDDGERKAHQPTRSFEHQYDQYGADDKIRHREEAGTHDQVAIEDPVVHAGQETEHAKRPV